MGKHLSFLCPVPNNSCIWLYPWFSCSCSTLSNENRRGRHYFLGITFFGNNLKANIIQFDVLIFFLIVKSHVHCRKFGKWRGKKKSLFLPVATLLYDLQLIQHGRRFSTRLECIVCIILYPAVSYTFFLKTEIYSHTMKFILSSMQFSVF